MKSVIKTHFHCQTQMQNELSQTTHFQGPRLVLVLLALGAFGSRERKDKTPQTCKYQYSHNYKTVAARGRHAKPRIQKRRQNKSIKVLKLWIYIENFVLAIYMCGLVAQTWWMQNARFVSMLQSNL